MTELTPLALRKMLVNKRKSLLRISNFANAQRFDRADNYLGEYYIARMLRDESERIYGIAKANMLRDNLTGLEISTNTKTVKPGEAVRVGKSSLFECILGVQNGGTKVDMAILAAKLAENGIPAGVITNCIQAATVGTTPPKTYIVRPLHDDDQQEEASV